MQDLLSAIDKRLVEIEKQLSISKNPPTIISLYCHVKCWLPLFRSITSLVSCLRDNCDDSRPISSNQDRVTLAGVLQELEELLSSAHILGLDACTADITHTKGLEWLARHKAESEGAHKADEVNISQEQDPARARTVQFESQASARCFHDLLHRRSNIERAVINQLDDRSLSSNHISLLFSSSGVRENDKYHRFHLRLPSTMQQQSLLAVVVREIYKDAIGSYLHQFVNWIFAGGLRKDHEVIEAMAICVASAQGMLRLLPCSHFYANFDYIWPHRRGH